MISFHLRRFSSRVILAAISLPFLISIFVGQGLYYIIFAWLLGTLAMSNWPESFLIVFVIMQVWHLLASLNNEMKRQDIVFG